MYGGMGAKFTVALETAEAEKSLKKLEKAAETTAGRLGAKGGTTGNTGQTAKGGGLGGALGTGMGIAKKGFGLGKRAAGALGAYGSLRDITSEGLAGLSAGFDAWMGAPAARATKAAREDTVQSYAEYWRSVGADVAKPEANAYFKRMQNQLTPLYEAQSGLNKFLGGPQGGDPNLDGPVDKMTNAILDEVKTQGERIRDLLPQEGGR